MKVKNLTKYYVIKDYERQLNDEQIQQKLKEIEYIQKEVIFKRDVMREKKTDEELLNDVRYLGKYSDYLLQRIQNRNDYQRLGFHDPNVAGKSISKLTI